METIQAIATIVSQVGFPIAMAGVISYILYQQMKATNEQSQKWAQTLTQNTDAIGCLKEMVTELKELLYKVLGDDSK